LPQQECAARRRSAEIPSFKEAAPKPDLLSYGALEEEPEFLPILFGKVLEPTQKDVAHLPQEVSDLAHLFPAAIGRRRLGDESFLLLLGGSFFA
jgi:hypothetical protein